MIKEGSHVRVRPDATVAEVGLARLHPHAGRSGIVTELLGVRVVIGKPRAMIKIDAGDELAGRIMIVSLHYLEEIP